MIVRMSKGTVPLASPYTRAARSISARTGFQVPESEVFKSSSTETYRKKRQQIRDERAKDANGRGVGRPASPPSTTSTNRLVKEESNHSEEMPRGPRSFAWVTQRSLTEINKAQRGPRKGVIAQSAAAGVKTKARVPREGVPQKASRPSAPSSALFSAPTSRLGRGPHIPPGEGIRSGGGGGGADSPAPGRTHRARGKATIAQGIPHGSQEDQGSERDPG
eukprot:CAMPEP_0113951206 /NCGR_PEP_ID=MMETSP1339-20121228/84944_1 /TAXON_ID=94617 /ORGANISM="Fibrocapsa japonica" /LENGTH=219 /DNA_ID=CAMNT_0000959377 /DNA_START=34 /DNA_END=690 /DNA_ORIENTATION=+ /assembly_acc=CAM_ASM_000762